MRSDRRVAAVLAVALTLALAPPRARSESPSDLVGRSLPRIRTRPIIERLMPGLLPRDVNPAEHAGHPMLLWTFATWCRNCRAMEPELRRLHARFAPQDVRFIALSTEARETLYAHHRRRPVPWRVGQTTGHAMHQLHARALPTYYFVDRIGVVRGAHVGGGSRATRAIERGLEALVAPR